MKKSFVFQLVISFITAIYVMIFLNVFVGSMGGVSAFAGIFVAFCIMYGRLSSEKNEVTGKLFGVADAQNNKEISSQVWKQQAVYIAIYTVVWLVMKIVSFLSKFFGWGNIKNLRFGEYFKGIYGSSALEVWAYIFAAILMFAIVVSFFPMLNIKNSKRWIKYLALNSILWSFVCVVIVFVSRFSISKSLRKRAVCVLDDLLLCNIKSLWIAAAFLIAITVVLIAEIFLAHRLALYEIEKHSQSEKDDGNVIPPPRRNAVIFVAALSIAFMTLSVYFISSFDNRKQNFSTVANVLTKDAVMGPIEYDGQMYVPIAMDLDYYETGTAVGYMANKNQNTDSRLYRLTVSNVIYTSGDSDNTYLQVYGADMNSYKKLSVIEKVSSWKDDEVYLLWDEQWSSESAYSKDFTGFSECSRDVVTMLEEEFGEVELNPDDFEDYDAYFTIESYKSLKEAMDAQKPIGTWVGCILVKDNKFYYGNYENQITGGTLQKLRYVLGGN